MAKRTALRQREITGALFCTQRRACGQRKLCEVALAALCKEQPQLRKRSPQYVE